MKTRRRHNGLGFRLYGLQAVCPLCGTRRRLVFVLGWGNFLRCAACLTVVCRRAVMWGCSYAYMRGPRLIRHGVELK